MWCFTSGVLARSLSVSHIESGRIANMNVNFNHEPCLPERDIPGVFTEVPASSCTLSLSLNHVEDSR